MVVVNIEEYWWGYTLPVSSSSPLWTVTNHLLWHNSTWHHTNSSAVTLLSTPLYSAPPLSTFFTVHWGICLFQINKSPNYWPGLAYSHLFSITFLIVKICSTVGDILNPGCSSLNFWSIMGFILVIYIGVECWNYISQSKVLVFVEMQIEWRGIRSFSGFN